MSLQQTKLFSPERQVVLPAGFAWYNYWDKCCYQGGQTIALATPIDSMPILVKAGAVIPHGPQLQYHDQVPADPLTIEVYAGADGEFCLYEDEGDSYRYEQGAYSEIQFAWNEQQRCLSISARQGQFSGMLAQRRFDVVLIEPLQQQQQTVHYVGDALCLYWK